MATPSPARPHSLWKGKLKALDGGDVDANSDLNTNTDPDFTDLNPTITYRHLFSQNLGVKDPLRVVALCDSDAFYAACEEVRIRADPEKPLVVRQWDSLIAVNYPARKFGISRMDKADDALKKCPELNIVHVATYKEGEKEPGYWDKPDTRTHKVSLDFYRRESVKIYQMFKDGLPGAEIEKASIDEAFIDFTRPVREKLFERYPYLSRVPPDAPNGVDTPLPVAPPINWENLGTIIPVSDESEEVMKNGEEAMEEAQTTWHDVALSIGAEMMAKVRREIYEKLAYTLSAGIARNKFLAKLTASYLKPNNQSVLRNAAIPNYLRPMPFQKIRFLGGKLGEALAQEYDVKTVGDLLTINLDEMQRRFGEESIWVYEVLRGIDRSEVKEKSAITKSMLASKNLAKPIVKTSEGHHWIRVLAAELALRLTDARKVDAAIWPKSLVLHVRQGYETSRSKQAPFPFARTVSVDVIAAAGDKLWKELVGTGDSRPNMKITNVSLAFSGLESMETGQQGIEDFLRTPTTPRDGLKRKRSDEERTASSETTSEGHGLVNSSSSTTLPTSSSFFLCKRCDKRIHLPPEFADLSDLDSIKQEALAVLKMEHDDYHLALDLSKAPLDEPPGGVIKFKPSSNGSLLTSKSKVQNAKKKRRKGEETKGIEGFFKTK